MNRFDNIPLANYSRKEDWINSVTHMIGVVFAIVVIVLCQIKAYNLQRLDYMVLSGIYGLTVLTVFTCSSVYHALNPSYAKKVMRVVDHAVINLMIVGTLTPYMVLAVIPLKATMGWTLLIACWILSIIAVIITFVAFDKTKAIQMVLYLVIGVSSFATVFVLWNEFSKTAIFLMIAGGVAHIVGIILYGIGAKKKYVHAIFHMFVILGALLHFLGLYLFVFV